MALRSRQRVYGWGIGGELVYGKEFEKVNLRVGGQYQYNKSITDYVETELSGREVLSTNHGYAYGELTGSFGKLNYNLGLGLKTLTTKNGATSHTTVSNNTTLTLMMPFGKGWSLNYIVFHRPTPPSISQLSTVESVVDDYYIYQGNPDLKSGQMIYNRIQFRYAHKNGFSATFRLKYGRTFNPIVRTVYYDAAREKFIGRPNNEKHLDDPGVELSLSKQRLWDHLDLSGAHWLYVFHLRRRQLSPHIRQCVCIGTGTRLLRQVVDFGILVLCAGAILAGREYFPRPIVVEFGRALSVEQQFHVFRVLEFHFRKRRLGL